MVLIAIALITKNGKNLLTRQFVTKMTKLRLEGLIEVFPKLVAGNSSQRQHTFIETESVRYVYQPLDDIYVVLITTKQSNILEDLEALRLFARVVTEYCSSVNESGILNNAFELIFAFDEIVALGYRENVNLAMIRTYTEMDSHEERIHKQILNAQMREAISRGQQRAKELKNKKYDHDKRSGMSSGTAISSSNAAFVSASTIDRQIPATKFESSKLSTNSSSKALKLGSKGVSDEAFLEKLRDEGQIIADVKKVQLSAGRKTSEENLNREAVLVKLTEKLSATVSRNGGVESADVTGSLTINVNDSAFVTTALKIGTNSDKQCQMQVHPNMDKNSWQTDNVLKLKNVDKTYPLKNDVGLLKWRLPIEDEEDLPLVLNVFPNEQYITLFKMYKS
uniref:Coatomer subunit delta n=1 Tax=Panagrolaimus sp. JU765 TaxID=591449 RepID=A0AC34Q5T1_9BILA